MAGSWSRRPVEHRGVAGHLAPFRDFQLWARLPDCDVAEALARLRCDISCITATSCDIGDGVTAEYTESAESEWAGVMKER